MPAHRKTSLPAALADMALNYDEQSPVSQQAFRILRDAIVRCVLLPGTPLSEKEVSDLFKVSRQPVREAFIKLAESGLVKVLPQRGTFVKKISVKQVLDGRFIREAIEIAVIKRATHALSDQALTALADNITLQAVAAENNDLSEFLSLDDAFHELLALGIDCQHAWSAIEDIKVHMDRVRYLTLGDIAPLSYLLDQHRAIFAALRARDENAAEQAVHHHLSLLNSTLAAVSEHYPDWFE